MKEDEIPLLSFVHCVNEEGLVPTYNLPGVGAKLPSNCCLKDDNESEAGLSKDTILTSCMCEGKIYNKIERKPK